MALLRALIVDDQPHMRLCIQAILIACGFDCILASTGLEALHYASSSGIDLIVTDIDMPQMDGWELLGLIARGAFGLAPPPVIVCSALADERDFAKRFAALGHPTVSKPVVPAQLIDALKRAFKETT